MPNTSKKNKQLQLVYIVWEDAMGTSSWKTMKEAVEWGDKDNFIIHEIGWIIKETKKYILLGAMYSPGVGSFEEDKWTNLERIPKTWIHKRIDLTNHVPKIMMKVDL